MFKQGMNVVNHFTQSYELLRPYVFTCSYSVAFQSRLRTSILPRRTQNYAKMSSDYLPDLPQGFDPALLSAPGTPPCTDVDYEFQALNSFYASCAFEENGNLQAHLSSLETIDPALLSHPTSPVPLSQPNSPGSISSHRPDTTRAQPAIDPYELFPWHPSSGNHAALAVQSACPSPVLPSFDLSPQQARATSQPPEDHQPFRDVDDNLAPPHTPSMSFHRIVQPRGKRSHAYHPYSRRHESAPKRKRPIKPSAPTSALKLVSLGDNALAERIKLNGSSPEDPSYHVAYPRGDRNEQVDQDWAFEMATASPHSLISGCNYSQNSLPQLGGPVHSNAKANADSVKSIPPDAKDVTKDLRYLPETSLSLKLASHVQTLAQLCIEIQTSLQGAISPDWANGDISYRIKIEQ